MLKAHQGTRPSYFFSLLLLAVLGGCDTNPPLAPLTSLLEFGKIVLSANIDSAAIFLDNVNTGKHTPDTVVATTGMHFVRLEKPGYYSASQTVRVAKDSLTVVQLTLEVALAQKVVLIEDFSNVSCIPCVTSNLILRSLVGGTYSRSYVVAVKYATNFPSPTDPFYLAAQSSCDARIAYYHILFAPTTIVDGFQRPTATDSLEIKDSINVRLSQSPRFAITLTKVLAGNEYLTTVSVQTLDTTGLDFSNLVLHTVVVEGEIDFTSPPGANGETGFRDVMRAMVPSAEGEVLTSAPPGKSIDYQRQVPLLPAWNAAQLQTVAFIQNKQTRVIYQTGSTYQ